MSHGRIPIQPSVTSQVVSTTSLRPRTQPPDRDRTVGPFCSSQGASQVDADGVPASESAQTVLSLTEIAVSSVNA